MDRGLGGRNGVGVGDLGINMTPLDTTLEQQHQHITHTVLDSSGTCKKNKKKTLPKVNDSISSYY